MTAGCRARGAARRLRRKWLNHHVASTSRAAPVSSWPRPLKAFTRAVSTIGSPITDPDGVCTSIVTSDVPFDRASIGIVTSVVAPGSSSHRRCRVAGTPAGSVRSPGRRCCSAVVLVLPNRNVMVLAFPASVNVNGSGGWIACSIVRNSRSIRSQPPGDRGVVDSGRHQRLELRPPPRRPRIIGRQHRGDVSPCVAARDRSRARGC